MIFTMDKTVPWVLLLFFEYNEVKSISYRQIVELLHMKHLFSFETGENTEFTNDTMFR